MIAPLALALALQAFAEVAVPRLPRVLPAVPAAGLRADGVALSPQARRAAVARYQRAINEAVAELKAFTSHPGAPGVDIEMTPLSISGGLIDGTQNLGERGSAVRLQVREVWRYAKARGDTTMAESMAIHEATRTLLRRIYERHRVVVKMEGYRSDLGPRETLPIEEVVGAGLERHLHLLERMKSAPYVQVTSRRFSQVTGFLDYYPEELAALAGKSLLSIGEGASDFAKTLEDDYGTRAVALDGWYDLSAREIDRHVHVSGGFSGDKVDQPLSGAEAIKRRPSRFIVGLLPHLPFAGGSFDVVVASHLMYWLIDRGGAFAGDCLREMARILKADGHMRFNVGARNREIWESLIWRTFPKADLQWHGTASVIVLPKPRS